MSKLEMPFAFASTATEVLDGIDLAGKTMIVTGGNGGFGQEIVRALAGAGAAVVLTARNTAAAEPVAEALRRSTGNPEITVRALDLSNLAAVHRFAAEWDGPIDALVNNAGIMALPSCSVRPRGERCSSRRTSWATLR